MSAPDASSEVDPLLGRVVEGRFQVLSRIAAGGMGVVYEAKQVPLGRKVALKVLEVGKVPGGDKSFRERFFLEASAAARLAHPNTIVVYDYGSTEDGLCFIAMEHLEGGTLSRHLKKKGPLAPADAIHVGLQIASSLRDAHDQGLVHRDLKPGNVMFAPRGGDPLFVKVLDFGLVKVLDQGKDALQLTQSGVMMGSPRYMAPEQVKAQPTDCRTDIYSFGAVLFHVLTGAPPFHAGSAFEAMQHHVYSAPPALKQVWPACPAGPMLEGVVMRCLQKEPLARYQSMDELMSALHACAAEAGGGVSGVGSYLGRGASGSGPDGASFAGLPPPPRFNESPSSPSNPGSGSGPQGQSGIVSKIGSPESTRIKTLKFESAATSPPTITPVAQPASSGGSGLILAIGAVLALALAGAVVLGIVLLVPSGDPPTAQAAPRPEAPPPAPEVPVVRPPPEVPVEPPPAPAAPTMHLVSDPAGATVRREGSDLGDTPLDLRIPPGERWTIEISLESYATRVVTLQGGQSTLTVHLEPIAVEDPRPIRRPPTYRPPVVRPLAPAPPPTIHTPPPTIRRPNPAPDLDDPWAGRR